MNFYNFVWNYQGAASVGVRWKLSFIHLYKLCILVLVEPRIAGRQAGQVFKATSYSSSNQCTVLLLLLFMADPLG